MKKLGFSALLLSVLMLCVTVVPCVAYGVDDSTLTVTHVNTAASYEGAAIIYTPQSASTIASYGTFEWWYIAVFDWDADEGAYTVVRTDVSNKPKADTVIPDKGFVYAVCVGNDWPAVYASDPVTYAAYKDHPNYINEPTRNSYQLVAKLKKGDKAYCYGGDFLNGKINVNGELWYTDSFRSDTYIKIGSPDAGKTAFNPDEADKIPVGYKLGVHAANTTATEGLSVIYTPAWGATARKAGSYIDYAWCKVAVFDWNDDKNAYEVISVSNGVGSNVPKDAVIPENGFVLTVNLGNDYSGTGGLDYTNNIADNTFKSLVSIAPGDLAYLTGIDLSAGKVSTGSGNYYAPSFTTDGYIYINIPPTDGIYAPDTTKQRLETPVLLSPDATVADTGSVVSWEAVDGCEEYLVSCADSSAAADGEYLFFNRKVTGTSLELDAADYKTGHSYTVSVVAAANGARQSRSARKTFYVVSENAFSSIFCKSDKKVVAFGDSLTAFTGWVAMMRAQLGVEVINAGVGGNTTIHAKARIDDDVIALKPDVVIMNFGMNDAAVSIGTDNNLVPLADYEANMRAMAKKIIDSGAKLVLVTPHHVCTAPNYYTPGYGLDYNHISFDSYIEVIKNIASDLGAGLIDINTLSKSESATDFCALGDGVHQSEYGHEKYCEWISTYLLDNFTSEDDFARPEESQPESESQEASSPVSDVSEATEGGFNWIYVVPVAALVAVAVAVAVVLKRKNAKK